MFDFSDHRLRSAAETLSLVEPHFGRLGITRLARQTGLDRIGIPCFAAIRPNSRTLAAHYGKGVSDDAAKVSAVMEALEFAVAESPVLTRRVSSARQLLNDGELVCCCDHLMPAHQPIDPDFELFWTMGESLKDGERVWVPLDAVALGDAEPSMTEMARTTNGLASGNTPAEATLHGLCELVERDALTLWSFQSDPEALARHRMDPAAFGSAMIDEVARRVGDSGLDLRLFGITTDIGAPVIQAVLSEPHTTEDSRRFDVAAGSSCHPVAARAALAAIVEAAQSRLTNIAGSRDDFAPEEYRQSAGDDLAALLTPAKNVAPPPPDLTASRDADGQLKALQQALYAAGIGEVIAINLGGEDLGLAVRKIISPDLEDNLSNRHWHPGRRAFRAMLGGI